MGSSSQGPHGKEPVGRLDVRPLRRRSTMFSFHLTDYSKSMKKYSKELKENNIARMLPPGNAYITDLPKETGIPCIAGALSIEMPQAALRRNMVLLTLYSSEDKLSVVIETAAMNVVELSQYCRQKGLYQEQIAAWRTSCSLANARPDVKIDREKIHHQAKEIKQLKRELLHKEKALAETAALLVLKKNSTFFSGSKRKIDTT